MGNKFSHLQKHIQLGDKRYIMDHLERHKINVTSKLDYCGTDCDGHIQEQISVLHFLVAFLDEAGFQMLLRKQKEDVSVYVDIKTVRTLKTPLMYAVLHNNPSIIRLLIECKCDVNITDRSGNTALHYAAQKGFVYCVTAILESGLADVGIRNTEFYKTALNDAKYYRRTEVVDILQNHIRKLGRYSITSNNTNDSGIQRESSRESILSDIPNGGSERDVARGFNSSPTQSYDPNQDHGLLCEKYNKQLKKNHEKIVLYLKVNDVLDKMYTQEFFNREKFNEIRNETCTKQVHLILDILYAKSNRKFEEFIDILRLTGQEALAHTIENTPVEPDPVYNQDVGLPTEESRLPPKSKVKRDQYRSCVNLSNTLSTAQSYIQLANESDDWNM